MSETPALTINMSEYRVPLTDEQIENREVTDDRIELFEDTIIRPEVFGTAEARHETVQPPIYEAPSHSELLRQSIEASPHLALVKDIADVGVAMGTIRRSQIAA